METNKRLTFPVKLLPLLNGEDNTVICPYGIKTVISMVAEGASDESLKQILQVFGYDSLEELRKSVLTVQDERCSAFKSKNYFELDKGDANLELLTNFKQILEEGYEASVSENVSASEAALFLRNVAEFKAEWLHAMERDEGQESYFHNADGSVVHPAFLNATRDYLYYRETEYKGKEYTYTYAVAVPYKFEEEAIPYDLVLVDTNKELTAEVLENIFSNMRLGECELAFPEFSIKNEHDLVPVMNNLGLNAIFNQTSSGLDKIATQPLYAEGFSQEAEIEVDKNGTVAKAVTDMDCFLGDFISDAEQLVFNHPFHYFLRNTTTGELLFMGKVNKLENYKR